MTHLRKRMLEELQRRNYSEGTTVANPLESLQLSSVSQAGRGHHRKKAK